jgi:hypothetical protein
MITATTFVAATAVRVNSLPALPSTATSVPWLVPV